MKKTVLNIIHVFLLLCCLVAGFAIGVNTYMDNDFSKLWVNLSRYVMITLPLLTFAVVELCFTHKKAKIFAFTDWLEISVASFCLAISISNLYWKTSQSFEVQWEIFGPWLIILLFRIGVVWFKNIRATQHLKFPIWYIGISFATAVLILLLFALDIFGIKGSVEFEYYIVLLAIMIASFATTVLLVSLSLINQGTVHQPGDGSLIE